MGQTNKVDEKDIQVTGCALPRIRLEKLEPSRQSHVEKPTRKSQSETSQSLLILLEDTRITNNSIRTVQYGRKETTMERDIEHKIDCITMHLRPKYV